MSENEVRERAFFWLYNSRRCNNYDETSQTWVEKGAPHHNLAKLLFTKPHFAHVVHVVHVAHVVHVVHVAHGLKNLNKG